MNLVKINSLEEVPTSEISNSYVFIDIDSTIAQTIYRKIYVFSDIIQSYYSQAFMPSYGKINERFHDLSYGFLKRIKIGELVQSVDFVEETFSSLEKEQNESIIKNQNIVPNLYKSLKSQTKKIFNHKLFTFYGSVSLDRPLEGSSPNECSRLAENSRGFSYLSGRSMACYPFTMSWLESNGFPYSSLLLNQYQTIDQACLSKAENLIKFASDNLNKEIVVIDNDIAVYKKIRELLGGSSNYMQTFYHLTGKPTFQKEVSNVIQFKTDLQ